MGVMHTCNYPGCAKQFDRKYNLKCHLRIHSNEKPYRCHHQNCSRSFRWKSSLNHHLMSLDHTPASVRRARKAKANKKKIENRLHTTSLNTDHSVYTSLYNNNNNNNNILSTLPLLSTTLSRSVNENPSDKLQFLDPNYLRQPLYLDDQNTNRSYNNNNNNNLSRSSLPINQPDPNFTHSPNTIIYPNNIQTTQQSLQRIWSDPIPTSMRKQLFPSQISYNTQRVLDNRFDQRKRENIPVDITSIANNNRSSPIESTSWQNNIQERPDESIDHSSTSNVTSPYGDIATVLEPLATIREKQFPNSVVQNIIKPTDALVSVYEEPPSNMVMNGISPALDPILSCHLEGAGVRGF